MSSSQEYLDDPAEGEDNGDDNIDDSADTYGGIRRSGRSRKEPERLNIEDEEKPHTGKARQAQSWNYDDDDSSSESDDDKPAVQPSKRLAPVRRRPPPPPSKSSHPVKQKTNSYTSDDSSLESEDDENKRSASRRTAAATVSYKEASEDEKTDSEDLVEVEYMETDAPPAETEKCETIEKILAQRRGKIGVTGNTTTIYCVEESGDPNFGTDPADLEVTELHYLIKWKDWAHIHNTWESEQSLRDQKVKTLLLF